MFTRWEMDKGDGRKIDGYVNEKQLKSGSIGITYRAIEESSGEVVVLKLLPELIQTEESLSRFNREMKILKRLRGHPNIVPLRRFGVFRGVPYIVTDFIDGGTLGDVLKRNPNGLDIKTVIDLFRGIAAAVDVAHQNRVIHRDLKPSNILLQRVSDDNYIPFVADFGVAALLDPNSTQTTASVDTQPVGSIAYQSPGIIVGSENPKTPAADIYALGVMLYEALEGKQAFYADNKTQIMYKVLNESLETDNIKKKANTKVVEVILKAIDKNPQKRYRTATELIDELEYAYYKGEKVEIDEIRRKWGFILTVAGFVIAFIATCATVAGLPPIINFGSTQVAVILGFKTSTPTNTITPSITPSLTHSPTPTNTPSFTPTTSDTPTLTPTRTLTPTQRPTLTLISTDTPIPSSPSGTGSNYKLAFNRNSDIYTINDDGSELTLVSVVAGSCSWSPDGSRIAFDTTRDGSSRIYLINADGKNPQALTDGRRREALPAWSPDGEWIAFQANGDIYRIHPDRTEEERLTNNLANDQFAAWSPDGKQIVFVSGESNAAEIYVMNADGSDQRQLTSNSVEDVFPDWSPDGKQVVFTSKLDGSSQIYVMNIDDLEVKQLTDPSTGENDYPSWSPDGTRIAFDSLRSGNWSVYIMNADGSEQTRLAPDGTGYYAPCWRPVPGY